MAAVYESDLDELRRKVALLQSQLKKQIAHANCGSLPISGHFVYIMRDETGAVIYVGVTSCLWGRLGQHATSKPKRLADAAHLSVIAYDTRREADDAERELIEVLQPPLNKMGIRRRSAA